MLGVLQYSVGLYSHILLLIMDQIKRDDAQGEVGNRDTWESAVGHVERPAPLMLNVQQAVLLRWLLVNYLVT